MAHSDNIDALFLEARYKNLFSISDLAHICSSLQPFIWCRNVVGNEFDEWIGKLPKLLLENDLGKNCLLLMRRIYVLIAATKYNRR